VLEQGGRPSRARCLHAEPQRHIQKVKPSREMAVAAANRIALLSASSYVCLQYATPAMGSVLRLAARQESGSMLQAGSETARTFRASSALHARRKRSVAGESNSAQQMPPS